MKNAKGIALIAAFVVPFFAVGIPYWPIPYSKISLPNSLYGIGLVVVFLAAVACRYFAAVRFRSATLSAGAAVPAVIMARVVYETAIDPTSHNLWPFELVIAAGVGFLIASAGSLVGGFLMPHIRSAQAGKSPISPRVSRCRNSLRLFLCQRLLKRLCVFRIVQPSKILRILFSRLHFRITPPLTHGYRRD